MIEIIDKVVDRNILEKSVKRFREKGIILPTFEQLKNPAELVPGKIKDKLKDIGLWDRHPLNLFRITWKNEPKEKGGLFEGVNYMEIPGELRRPGPTAWGSICSARTAYDASNDVSSPWVFLNTAL